MTETLHLNNIGLKGLSIDPLPWSLPPEFITFGQNFRIFAGSIQNSGGEVLWSTAPTAFNPGHLFHVGSTNSDFWLVMGRDKIYAFDGVTWSDLTSAAGYAGLSDDDELLWSACMLGGIPIVNNPLHVPEYWSPVSTGQILQPLDFDPSNTWIAKSFHAKVFRSHRNFLFALNLEESGVEFPDSYRWSHPADINGLPVTWDETDDAFLAGKASLGGDGGVIIDGLSLRDAFAIYSESAIDVLDFTADEFVWRRRELSSTSGLLSRNSIVEVKGIHFLLSEGDIIRNDGNKIESIIHNRIAADFSSRIDQDNYDRSYVIRNNEKKEIWFCIPEAGVEFPNVAFIYNWRDDSWAIRDITPTGIAYSATGSQSEPAEDWDTFIGNWDDSKAKWGSAALSPLNETLVSVDRDNETLYLVDTTTTPDNDYQFTIERTDFPLLGDKQLTTITRIYPHIQSQGSVTIEIGSQDFPDASIRYKPAVIFNPATDRKIDVRTTGELHCWRISSLGKHTISMSGMTIEFVKAGFR